MSELKIENVKNLEQPNVQELLNKFKKRHDMDVVDVAEIISQLISTLKLDYDSGRPKTHTIAGGHLGQILGIGKGVVSQYLSVWNMHQESKDFLKNYNLSLINAYEVSRIKGKDEAEIIKLQKAKILEKRSGGSGQRADILIHTIKKAEMICKSVCVSENIPKDVLEGKILPEIEEDIRTTNPQITYSQLLEAARMYKFYAEQCIKYTYPNILKLPYLKNKLEFCNIMLENNETEFCGCIITKECLIKQIQVISDNIKSIEAEQKSPSVSSLLMVKDELDKYI